MTTSETAHTNPASDSPSPFTYFSEMVCRHSMEKFTLLQEMLFHYACYGFRLPSKYRRFAGDVLHVARGFGTFQDYNLPRGRYFAICNARQMENIHIAYEMKAYTSPKEQGPFFLGDASQQHLCDRFALKPVANALFTLLNPQQIAAFTSGFDYVPPHLRPPNQEDIAAVGERLGKQLGHEIHNSFHHVPSMGWEGIVVYFPLDKSILTTSKCIDLRQPSTRQWFFERYRRGIAGWPGHGYDAADVLMTRHEANSRSSEHAQGFIQMLPALCNHDLGGRLIGQVIGADLRMHGVDCLVYPSARCDAFAEFHNGALVDSYGWNLVDYRGTQRPKSPAEEGVIYLFLGDLVLDSQGRFAENSPRNAEKRRDLDQQVRIAREITGKDPVAVLADPNNPWIPKIFPFVQVNGKDPFSFRLDTELLLKSGEYPEGDWPYKGIEITEGEQCGSFAIEGVQAAYDDRERALVGEYLKRSQPQAQ